MPLNTRYLPHEIREALKKLIVNAAKPKLCFTQNYSKRGTGCFDRYRDKKFYKCTLKGLDRQNSGR